MKRKSGSRLCFIIISILLFFSCNNNKDPDISEKKAKALKYKNGGGNIFISQSDASRYIGNFETYYRRFNGNNIDSLSKSVWIDKSVIDILNQYLKNPSNGLDGVRVYSIAYDPTMTQRIVGRKYTFQSSVIIVPTMWGVSPSRSNHIDRWDVFPDRLVKGGMNHGELCPDSCH